MKKDMWIFVAILLCIISIPFAYTLLTHEDTTKVKITETTNFLVLPLETANATSALLMIDNEEFICPRRENLENEEMCLIIGSSLYIREKLTNNSDIYYSLRFED